MTCRTGNVIVSFMDLDDDPTPMFTAFNVSTQGYRSPDAPYRYAPAWLKPNITIDKSIGTVFWNERSGVEFGNVDIAIENGGLVHVAGSQIDWIAWAQGNPNPQAVISMELSDGTLEHIATADGRDVYFPDDRTIRVTLETKHAIQLDQFINLYYSGTGNEDIDGQARPIYWGAGMIGASPFKVMPTVFLDETTLRYDVTDLDIVQGVSPSPYFVRDRGVISEEGMSPGFVVVDSGFELTANPDGKITWVWNSSEGGGVLDPLETGELLQGGWRICRLIVDRVDIDYTSFFPHESEFSAIQVVNVSGWPTVNYQSEISASDALTDIMDDVGGWWYVDELGNFQFGLLEAPESLSPIATYTDQHGVGDISVQVDRAPGLSDRLNYNWRPGFYQADELAGSIGNSGGLVREWTTRETVEPIPEIYETARGHAPMEFASAGFGPGAQNELDRRWSDLYDRTRRFYSFTIGLGNNTVIPNLGEAVQVSSQRFRMLGNGLSMYVRRVKLDLGQSRMTLVGWGSNPVSTPLAPTNLAIVGDGLEWDDNAFNETGYRVEESADGVSGWTTTDTLPANSTSYAGPLDDGLFYRVFAVNGAGDSAPSNVVEFVVFQRIVLYQNLGAGNSLIQTYEWDGSDWSSIGNSGSLVNSENAGIGSFAPGLIVSANTATDDLRSYGFDGTDWAQTGNPLAISISDIPKFARLDNTTIAEFNAGTEILRTFSWDGVDWSSVGNGLPFGGGNQAPSLAGLNSTDIAFANRSQGWLRTYRWDGVNWSVVGNSHSVVDIGTTFTSIAALSATRIAFISGNMEIRTFDWDGTDWAQTASTSTSGLTGNIIICGIGDSEIALLSSGNDTLRVYAFDESDWSQVGNSLTVGGDDIETLLQ